MSAVTGQKKAKNAANSKKTYADWLFRGGGNSQVPVAECYEEGFNSI